MSYNEALDTMKRAAVNQSKIPFTACQGVINAIMAHYMITSGYYLENAVETFERFIKTMVLAF